MRYEIVKVTGASDEPARHELRELEGAPEAQFRRVVGVFYSPTLAEALLRRLAEDEAVSPDRIAGGFKLVNPLGAHYATLRWPEDVATLCERYPGTKVFVDDVLVWHDGHEGPTGLDPWAAARIMSERARDRGLGRVVAEEVKHE